MAPPAAPVTAAPAVTAEEARENALFEGRVELGVGPFYDIASLGAFERRLAGLPGVSEATVRRFEASHAVVDVRLDDPGGARAGAAARGRERLQRPRGRERAHPA